MFGDNVEILKGENPWSHKNWKKRQKERTFKEKLKDFCEEYHWGDGFEYDEDYNKIVNVSFKLFLFNVYRRIRGWQPVFLLRMFFQKVFRKNHISDDQLWNLQYPLSKYVYKHLKAFNESERHGYPGCFSEYRENEWKSKEEYDVKIESGEMYGGGNEAWEKILDHVLMALEYLNNEGDSKKEKEWFLRYFGMDPHEEGYDCNRHESYSYRNIDSPKGIGSVMSSHEPDLKKVEWATKSVSWINMDLIFYAEKIVQDGLELMGKFWRNFWD